MSRLFTGTGLDRNALRSLGVVAFFWRSHFLLPGPRALGCSGDNNLLSTPVCKVNAPSQGASFTLGVVYSWAGSGPLIPVLPN